ncbi:TetR family transcriptional regulator [Mycolicibacterium goodii]
MQELLLDTAEEMLRSAGSEGFSVRAVTAAASVNVAAVTTAFGGRSALIDALFARLMKPINDERARRYAALGGQPCVSDITRAFFEPLAVVNPEDGSATSALLRLLVTDPDTAPIDRLLRDPGIAQFDELLAQALSKLPAKDRVERIRHAVGTALSVTAWSKEENGLRPGRALNSLLAFINAGIAAPS